MRKENEEKLKKKKEEEAKKRLQKQEVFHEKDEDECGEIEELRVEKADSNNGDMRAQKFDSDKKSDEELQQPNEEEENRRAMIELKARKFTSTESLGNDSSQEIRNTRQEKEQIKYTSLQAASIKIAYNYIQILTLIWMIPRQNAEADSVIFIFENFFNQVDLVFDDI